MDSLLLVGLLVGWLIVNDFSMRFLCFVGSSFPFLFFSFLLSEWIVTSPLDRVSRYIRDRENSIGFSFRFFFFMGSQCRQRPFLSKTRRIRTLEQKKKEKRILLS
jgi:hypothetical protein